MPGNTISVGEVGGNSSSQGGPAETEFDSRVITLKIGNEEQIALSKTQRTLERELGLGERACAALREDTAQKIAEGLKKGEFKPGWFKRLCLWFTSNKREYHQTMQQFRQSKVLEKYGENFTQALKANMRSLNPEKFDDALQVALDLLSGNPEMRKDFFTQTLVDLANQASEISQGINPESPDGVSEELAKNYANALAKVMDLKNFCQGKIKFSSEDNQRVKNILNAINLKTDELILELTLKLATTQSDKERENLKTFISKLQTNGCTSLNIGPFMYLNETTPEQYKDLLQYFKSEDGETPSQNFKKFTATIKNLSLKVFEENSQYRFPFKKDEFEEKMREKLSPLFQANEALMWETLELIRCSKRNLFVAAILPYLLKLNSNFFLEFFGPCVRPVALEKIKNANNHSASDAPYTHDQIKLLLEGTSLEELVKHNKADDTSTVLQFVQNIALPAFSESERKELFNSILPDALFKTCQNLLEFIESGIPGANGQPQTKRFSDGLKTFIREQVKNKFPEQFAALELKNAKAQELKAAIEGNNSDEVRDILLRCGAEGIKLSELRPMIGETWNQLGLMVKDILKDDILKKIESNPKDHEQAKKYNETSKDIQNLLTVCDMDNITLETITGKLDRKGVFEFSTKELIASIQDRSPLTQ